MAIRNPSINLLLENGDRLSQPEFHRRYAAMPENFRAELVEGVVYVSSPLSGGFHGRQHADVVGWLSLYRVATPGVEVMDNSTVIIDQDNEVQPDILCRLEPALGGGSRMTESGYVKGPPELVVEVAASSVSYDAHVKRDMYRRAGIPEYLLWRVFDRAIDWWSLQQGEYVKLKGDQDGVASSLILPGLALDADALLTDDLRRVHEVQRAHLDRGVHAAFLRQRGGG